MQSTHQSNEKSYQNPIMTNTETTNETSSLRKRRNNNKNNNNNTRDNFPRLIQRDLPYHQSHSRVAVQCEKHESHILPLLMLDWFHVVLRWPVWFSLSILLTIWTSIILIFAAVYVKLDTINKDQDCGLGPPGIPIAWGTAFAFSLETCTTVGYGLPGSTNAFFEDNCPSVQVAIYTQMTWSMMFNAFLFAFFFLSLSRCEKRAYLVVFSQKLCIKTITSPNKNNPNKVVMTAQCFDLDSGHPVVETHARYYVLDKQLQLHPLRIESPNDEIGAVLFTSLPSHIVHHIDHYSKLYPPSKLALLPYQQNDANDGGILLRQADSATGSRDDIVCPICGESYGTYERFRKHVKYNQLVESIEDFPPELCHKSLTVPDEIPMASLEEIKQHIKDTISEIIVVVEGIDPQVSGTFQALESYKFEDIVWEQDFDQCFSIRNQKFVVDMKRFHMVKPISSSSSNSNNNNNSNTIINDDKNDNTTTNDDDQPIENDIEQQGSGRRQNNATTLTKKNQMIYKNGGMNGHGMMNGNGHGNVIHA